MKRREFLCGCAATAVAAQPAFAATALKPRFYSRARVVDAQLRPVKVAELGAGQSYIFHYPFEGTPCFLLKLRNATRPNVRLRTDAGATYAWPGGVGPAQAVVAYSAICTHRMAYPTRQITFISYRDVPSVSPRAQPRTIHCCAEHSQYDPASGARVLSGPAPQPLAAILLEYEPASDGLYAIGTLGGEMFNAFFAKYELRLDLDYGKGRARQRVGGRSVVTALEDFCKQQVRC